MDNHEIQKARRFNYTALIIVLILIPVIIFALYQFGFFSEKYSVKIVVPAGSTEEFVYADEEISPRQSTLKVLSGDNLGDCEVILYPVEVTEQRSYRGEYITPGLTVKQDVEKGGWYKIGVSVQNPTDEDIVVYLDVYDVELRIE